MEYTKDTMPDGTVYERYEVTPEEILELIERKNIKEKQEDDDYWDYMNETYLEEDLIYDIDDAIEFIQSTLASHGRIEVTRGIIKTILGLDEDYIRSIGIIES